MAYLLDHKYREIAALMVDAEMSIVSDGDGFESVIFEVPVSSLTIIISDESIKEDINKTLSFICRGYITDEHNHAIDRLYIQYRARLLNVEKDWRDIIRTLIVNAKNPNQGIVTEKAFAKRQEQVLIYNEMKFATHAEIRIAQELEKRKVLFFPLPLAVRNDTGNRYNDHREPDFLICHLGVWGILEISHHEGRLEKDVEKSSWFKKSGILCVEHRSTEQCSQQPSQVVDEFLSILAQYKR